MKSEVVIKMNEPHFIIHEEGDSCAVAVKEGLKANTVYDCWVMQEDTELKIEIKQDIPMGHKIAVSTIEVGDTIIKYGVDIGKCIAKIGVGEHLHVHNIKTKRW
jgi:(2R)-sulfolactate sulfo-lyase subunit alpha